MMFAIGGTSPKWPLFDKDAWWICNIQLDNFQRNGWQVGSSYVSILLNIYTYLYYILYIYIYKDRDIYIYYDPDIIHWEWKLQGLRMVLIPFVIIRNHQLQGSRCDGRCLIFEWRRCFAPAKQKTNKNNMSCTKRVPLEIAYFPWFHCIISILNCLWLLL